MKRDVFQLRAVIRIMINSLSFKQRTYNKQTTHTTTHTTNMEDIILAPFNHIAQVKGKEIRSQLIDSFNIWMKMPQEQLDIVKNVTGKLHNASLLIDDIEDNSQLRRGVPCAHLIFGVANTINSANYVYFDAMQDCLRLNCPDAIAVFIEELLMLHKGQGMDIYWRDNSICPSEKDYIEMVQNKTGGLFRLCIRMMEVVAKQQNNGQYTKLVNDLSVLFQILDDFLNLQSKEYHDLKNFAEDITEGKFSFPVIHSINASPNSTELLSILRRRPSDFELKQYAIRLMDKTDSFAYTVDILRETEEQVRLEIEKLGGNPVLTKIVDYLMSKMEQSASHASN
jgi:geranylgeranyl diphosphate synthase type 3